MECKQDMNLWFDIEQYLIFAKPERVLELTTEGFIKLVDIILNGVHYDKFPNANEVRLEHLKSVNVEYKECVSKLTAMIEAERSALQND